MVAVLLSAFATSTTASAPRGPEPNPRKPGILSVGDDEFVLEETAWCEVLQLCSRSFRCCD